MASERLGEIFEIDSDCRHACWKVEKGVGNLFKEKHTNGNFSFLIECLNNMVIFQGHIPNRYDLGAVQKPHDSVLAHLRLPPPPCDSLWCFSLPPPPFPGVTLNCDACVDPSTFINYKMWPFIPSIQDNERIVLHSLNLYLLERPASWI